MKIFLTLKSRLLVYLCPLVVFFLPLLSYGQSLNISGGVQTYLSLTNVTVNLSGTCELHLTATNNMMTTVTPLDAMPGCVVNLNSPDAWLFLDGTRPYRVNLKQFYINGAPAVLGTNVRLVEYGMGTVVIAQSPSYQPITVFSGSQFSGSSTPLSLYVYYNGATTVIAGETNNTDVPFTGAVQSFTLKRGYAATFAKNADGSGPSRVYIAAEGDVQIGSLPPGLKGTVGFIRCYPWVWAPKKGWAGGDGGDALLVDAPWNYDWGSGAKSAASCEYAPMQWGNGYSSSINNKQGTTMLLGFNEPNSSSQANMTTTQAINDWTNLLNSGLVLGSPACTDGGMSSWLYPFINSADAAGMRVDVVKQHMYMCGQTASSLQSWIYNIHSATGRRVGLTEFNNGANWTTCADPTYDQEAATIQAFIQMMDTTPWVESYNIYEWVETVRMMAVNGVLTPAGTNYLNDWSPIGYIQELSGNPTWFLAANGGVGATNATYNFNGDALDSSGNGNNALLAGSPAFVGSGTSHALALDGVRNYVVVPPNVGKAANFTFAAWVNWSGGANFQRIFDFGLDDHKYMFLTASSGSNLRFAINGGSGEQQLNAPILPTSKWTHVAVTISGSTAKLFTNGVIAASTTTLTNNPANLPLIYSFLGRSQFYGDPLFKGALANVTINGYALSDTQVAALAATAPAVSLYVPAAPTGLTATAISAGQINLAWTASSGANSYNVKRSTSPSGSYAIIAQGITSTSYSDTSVNAGTTYYYVASAVNPSGESANSSQASATTLTSVPAAPTALTVHAGSKLVSLQWLSSTSPGADTYNVKRATVSGGPYTTIASGITAPTLGAYTDTNVAFTTYYYVVSGVNSYGESANSAEVTATLRDLYAYWKFDETTGTTASDSAGSNPGTLNSGCTWVTGLTNGAVQLDGTANASISFPTGLVSPLTDFTIGTWVYWTGTNGWQRIFDFGSGTSTYMFLTPKAGSSGPLRFTINNGGGEQQINASSALPTGVWHHVAVTLSNTIGVLYLDGVAIATNSNLTIEPADMGNTTQNTIGQSQFSGDPHLVGSVDDFRIYGRALSPSEVAALVTGSSASPLAPDTLTATAMSGSQINLSWSTSVAATSYNVKRATVSGGPYTTIATGVTATSYSDTGLSKATTYYYVVTAVNGIGESPNSPQASVTTATINPYASDANTLALFHFDEAAGGSVTTNIGSLGLKAYSVDLTSASTTPPVVTTVLGAAAFSGFGNAASFASGQLIGWDANNSGAYNGDNGTTLSTDAVAMNKFNMGNGGQTAWTIEALVYCTATNANQEILATDSSAASRGFQFRINSSGKLELNLIATGPDIQTAIPATGAHAYAANTWYHVAATYDGTNIRLYWTRADVAGVTNANLISTTAASVGTTFGAASGPLCIGGENRAANGEYFQGRIDEVRISKVARAATGGFYW